jgi:hypothetical protein
LVESLFFIVNFPDTKNDTYSLNDQKNHFPIWKVACLLFLNNFDEKEKIIYQRKKLGFSKIDMSNKLEITLSSYYKGEI